MGAEKEKMKDELKELFELFDELEKANLGNDSGFNIGIPYADKKRTHTTKWDDKGLQNKLA